MLVYFIKYILPFVIGALKVHKITRKGRHSVYAYGIHNLSSYVSMIDNAGEMHRKTAVVVQQAAIFL